MGPIGYGRGPRPAERSPTLSSGTLLVPWSQRRCWPSAGVFWDGTWGALGPAMWRPLLATTTLPSSPDRHHLRQWVVDTSTCSDHCRHRGGGRHPAPKWGLNTPVPLHASALAGSVLNAFLPRISREVSVLILVVAGFPPAEVLLQFH